METITLAPGQYYSKDFIPSGIVYKNSTGIGATEHELYKAERHSLVISPLRSILESKKDARVLTLHGELLNLPGCANIISNYFSINGPKFKKIHVTIESLPTLLKYLIQLDVDVFKEFHYFLDEVHMFQTESDYRPALSYAFDYYKKFPKDRRTCISASVYPFSDPEMQSETITRIERASIIPPVMNLCLTNDPIQQLGFVLKHAQGPYHIFVNSISYARKAIDQFKLRDAAIYCSQLSKSKAGIYFKDFNPKPTNTYNFYTACCFAGCDIYSSGTQIIVAGTNGDKDFRLIKSDILQVIGRLRTNSSERYFIATYDPLKTKRTGKSKAALVSAANYRLHLALKKWEDPGQRRLLAASIERNRQNRQGLIRMNADKMPAINFPLIDNLGIRREDLHDLYSNNKGMEQFLRNLGTVKSTQKNFSNHILLPKVGRKSRITHFNSALFKIADWENDLVARLSDTGNRPFDSHKFSQDLVRTSTGIEKEFLKEYMLMPDPDHFSNCNGNLELLRISRLKKIIAEDHEMSYQINSALPIGQQFTTKSLVPIVDKLLRKSQIIEDVTNRNVKGLLRLFRDFKEMKVTRARVNGVMITG